MSIGKERLVEPGSSPSGDRNGRPVEKAREVARDKFALARRNDLATSASRFSAAAGISCARICGVNRMATTGLSVVTVCVGMRFPEPFLD